MSSTAAATNSRPSAPICPQRRRPTPLPPKPLPNQIPIDGQPLTSPRGFFLRRLSDAGPDTAVQVDDRPASETLHVSSRSAQSSNLSGSNPKAVVQLLRCEGSSCRVGSGNCTPSLSQI